MVSIVFKKKVLFLQKSSNMGPNGAYSIAPRFRPCALPNHAQAEEHGASLRTGENPPNLLMPCTCMSSARGVTPQVLGQLPVSLFLPSYYLEAESEGE